MYRALYLASGGTRQRPTLWRSSLRYDSAAALALAGARSCARHKTVRRDCFVSGRTASALSRTAQLTALASLSSFKQSAVSQRLKRAARADSSPPLLAATEWAPAGHRPPLIRQRGLLLAVPLPFQQRWVRAGLGAPLWLSPDTNRPEDCLCLAKARASGPGAEERRSHGRAQGAHPHLTCRRLFERRERSERSEFCDRP